MKNFLVVLPKNNPAGNEKKRPSSTSSSTAKGSIVKEPGQFSSSTDTASSSQQIKKRKLVQHFIDIGQKAFALPVTCPECQLLYVADDDEDIARHRAHCAKMGRPPVISSKSILQEQSLYSSVVDGVPVRVVCISETAVKVLQELRAKVYPLVEKDLNTSSDFLYDAVDEYTKVYVALQGSGAVLGLLIMEQIQPGQIRWIRTIDDLSTLSSNDASNGPSDESTGGAPIMRQSWAGVRVIWVHAQHRRQRWGERMLDCARGDYLFGHVMDKRAVAFSQPTTSGLHFAKKYLRPSTRSAPVDDSEGSSASRETPNDDPSLIIKPSTEDCNGVAVPCYV